MSLPSENFDRIFLGTIQYVGMERTLA
jgi:hypothetical protein